jgi:hypothetical protein
MSHKDPAKRAAYMRAYRAKNHDRLRERDRATEKVWRTKNREQRLSYEKVYRSKNRDRLRAKWKRWAAADRVTHPEKHREQHLVRLYGITQAQYDAMATAQNYECASCHAPAAGEKHGVLGVDHCHKTGKVRGLLCSKCNMIIGQANDDVELIKRWAAYLAGELPFQKAA